MTRLGLLALLATSCTTSSSSEVFTSGIHAAITARAPGDGSTVVSATLYHGNPLNLEFVALTGDDRLVASAAGETKQLVESQLLGTVVHRATFDTDGDGTVFEVSLERTIDEGAPSSKVALPTAFAIANAPQIASRGAPLVVSWAPAGAGDAMSWHVHGDCIEDQQGPITGDPGTVTIPAGQIVQRMGGVPDSCAIAVTIERSRTGTLDAHYRAGGSIAGIQARTATVTSTP